MKIINDMFVSLNKDSKILLDLKSSFVYNKYESKETQTNDNNLEFDQRKVLFENDNNLIKNKFIRLELPGEYFSQNNVPTRIEENIGNIFPELFEISNNIIKNRETSLFNFIETIQGQRENFILNITNEKYNEFVKFYSEVDKNNEIDSNLLKNNGSMYFSVDHDFYNNNLELFLNSNFNLKKNFEDLSVLNKLTKERFEFKKLEDISEKILNGNFFPNINPLGYEINYSNNVIIKEMIDINCTKCGIYIEKYRKNNNAEGDNYTFLCGKFITKKPNLSFKDIPLIFEDESIRYGETYRYVVRDVYLYITPTYSDRFTLTRFLMCDLPFITEDIICKEKVPPLPLENIEFSYNKRDDSLDIFWSKNFDNYQNDIKGFQIFRRNIIDEPFELLVQLEGHNKTDFFELEDTVQDEFIIRTPGKIPDMYKDRNYKIDKKYIYAIRSIDAHGMISNYSTQYGIKYNSFEKEVMVETVVESNSPPRQPNLNMLSKSSFLEEDGNTIENLPSFLNPHKISLYYTPDHNVIIDDVDQVSNENGAFDLTEEKNYIFSVFKVNENVEFKKNIKITTQ